MRELSKGNETEKEESSLAMQYGFDSDTPIMPSIHDVTECVPSVTVYLILVMSL